MSFVVSVINPEDGSHTEHTVDIDAVTYVRNLTGVGWQYCTDGPNGERGYMHPESRLLIAIPASALV